MSRLEEVFKKEGPVLIGYITVGYPSVEATVEAATIMDRNGVDIIELGIPFSDPVADGVTIQKASYLALQGGITPRHCMEAAGHLGNMVRAPLVFMTYYNPILRYGIEDFCADCAGNGVRGLIVPDLPPEEALDLEVSSHRHGLDLIYLLTPASSQGRIREVADRSRGFVYLVSTMGVTGVREGSPEGLQGFVERVRRVTPKPLCVGFGISTPQQAGLVANVADGVVVGSGIVEVLATESWRHELAEYCRGLSDAVKKAPTGD